MARRGLGGAAGDLFGRIGGRTTSDDADLVTHELVHHWLRQSGADEPRWVMRDGRAEGEAAIIQEGLANFVAAARSDNPILGGAAIARGQARPSLRVFARCPEALRGDAHDDSLVLSGALWEARRALTSDVVLAAVARAAPAASDRIANLSAALEEAFARDSDHSASVWREIAERHRLSHCADPIALSPDVRLSARSDSFVIPAPGHFTPRPERIESPQAFAITLPANTPSASLTLRSSRKDEPRLSLGWQTTGPSPTTGEVALTGWPVQQAELPVPVGATELVLHLVSRAPSDVTYNDLRVTFADSIAAPAQARVKAAVHAELDRTPGTAQATVAVEPTGSSTCGAGADPIGSLILGVAAIALALRRRPPRPVRLRSVDQVLIERATQSAAPEASVTAASMMVPP